MEYLGRAESGASTELSEINLKAGLVATSPVIDLVLVDTDEDVEDEIDDVSRTLEILYEEAGLITDEGDSELVSTEDAKSTKDPDAEAIQWHNDPTDAEIVESENIKLDDTVKGYLKMIGEIELLTPEEEV